MILQFPILSLTGPRQSGKTTLLKEEFPDYQYFNLERPDIRQLVMTDPLGFLNNQGEKIIFDEVQNLPDLFSYIQVVADERNTAGQFILSGSQSFLLNESISQSLAGRVYVSHLLPFDLTEMSSGTKKNEVIFKGFYPRLHQMNIKPTDFYPSYVQTYIERDVRSVKSIENLNLFTRFLGLCAGRVGQILNVSSLANDTGISVNTAKSWLSVLEASYILFLLQPYYQNFNKRIIKSPKLYFYDTGLACSLLRINDSSQLQQHYLTGSLFENLVIAEFIKQYYHSGKRPQVYYWRESNGTEIDCIIEKQSGGIKAIEIKAGETFTNDFLSNLKRFPTPHAEKIVIYSGSETIKQKDFSIVSYNNLSNIYEDL